MGRTARTAGTIGLPFYWLIVASLWLALAPMYYLCKGIVAGVAYIAHRNGWTIPTTPGTGRIEMTPLGFRITRR